MKTILKMDEKGRIHIPIRLRGALGLGSNQLVTMEVKKNTLIFRRAQKAKQLNDKVLHDLLNPAKSKVKVTAELLEGLSNELWST